MSLHLAEVAQAVAPGAHGVMLMDRAGWHRAKDLVVPDNLTLVLLPARAPELNPVENIWQFLRDNWLSSRVFGSYRDIVDHCCDAWTASSTSLGSSCPSASGLGQCMMISAGWYKMSYDEQKLRERAYELWMQGGCKEGRSDMYWFQAERE